MDITIKVAALKKIVALSTYDLDRLFFLIKQGGKCEYSSEFGALRKRGLVKKVGPVAYLAFKLNGEYPMHVMRVGRKNVVKNEHRAFMSAFVKSWNKLNHGNRSFVWQGKDLSLIKKFRAIMPISDFKQLLKNAEANLAVMLDVGTLWNFNKKLQRENASGNVFDIFNQAGTQEG